LLRLVAGCGSNNNTTPTNIGLFGNWNIVLDQNGTSNPIYVFALALSQEGPNYSGSSIPYTGSVPVPSGMCINSSTLRATATTSGNDFTLTVVDNTTNTTITIEGSLTSSTGSLSGTFNSSSPNGACHAEQGSSLMSPQ
jgi:hypothetical protein